MINIPTTADLLERIPDKYAMIITIAERARELNGGSFKITSFDHVNNITIAAQEVYEGLLRPVEKPVEFGSLGEAKEENEEI